MEGGYPLSPYRHGRASHQIDPRYQETKGGRARINSTANTDADHTPEIRLDTADLITTELEGAGGSW